MANEGRSSPAAIALAERFRGEEVGSVQALQAAGISLAEQAAETEALDLSDEELAEAFTLCREVRTNLAGQAEGWKQRPLF